MLSVHDFHKNAHTQRIHPDGNIHSALLKNTDVIEHADTLIYLFIFKYLAIFLLLVYPCDPMLHLLSYMQACFPG